MIKIKLDKKDFDRILLTDTSPEDVPIIFSNDGFYINIKTYQQNDCARINPELYWLVKIIIDPIDQSKKFSQSHPYKYRIEKNEFELRTLSLTHPRAQFNYISFFERFSSQVCYQCSLSPYSIRAPLAVNNSLYLHDTDSSGKYKISESDIDTLESQLNHKHASSFFAYKGYNRIFKFFNSYKFVELEKKYSHLSQIDVANCFDTIYTHTITWSVKTKSYAKQNANIKSQFANRFDQLMQRSNNNETNGIPIGSETSRVFAEIVFKDIDVNIEKSLNFNHKLKLDIDYSVFRYVDDYIIFAKSKDISTKVCSVIIDELEKYNLYINHKKWNNNIRPFITSKTNIINNAKKTIDHLQDSLFINDNNNKSTLIFPRDVRNILNISKYFITEIKSSCKTSSASYSEVAPYLIGVFSRMIVTFNENVRKYNLEIISNKEEVLKIRDVVQVLLNLMFFFSSVNSTTSSSAKMAKAIIIVDKLFKDKFPNQVSFIRTYIMDNINQLPLEKKSIDDREGYISLERLNIILSTSDFGENYLLDQSFFKALIFDKGDESLDYFNIISLLYYFKNHNEYLILKDKIEDIASNILKSNFDLQKNSQSAHLFLDLICCPYISDKFKKEHLEQFFVNSSCPKNNSQIDKYLSKLNSFYWFVKWEDLNLLKLLERKELKQTY